LRQNIDEKWKTDPRRTALAKRIGARGADGMLVEITWLVLSHKGMPIPLKEFRYIENYLDWIDCGLAEVREEMVHVAGADRYREFFDKQVDNGRKGGRPKQTQRKPRKPKHKPEKPSSSISSSSSVSSSSSSSSGVDNPPAEPPGPVEDPVVLNRKIWDAYSAAYFTRYGTEPVRDKIVNSQIKKIGERLGAEAPDVAAFYVKHDKGFYVSNLHKIGLLLTDVEALRTQWATGRKVTQKQAMQADDSSALREQLKRFGGTK
jgi:hypothetical protein